MPDPFRPRDGRGVKKDSDKAAEYYRQAILLSWKVGSRDEVVAATAALILDNQIDYGNFEDILKIVEVLKMICAESAGQPADRAVVLLQALNLVEKEKGRRELKPAQMAEEPKKTTTKSKLISFIENLLADQSITIDSALAEVDHAASDPSIASLPRLQHRAALLIALAQAPAEGAKRDRKSVV